MRHDAGSVGLAAFETAGSVLLVAVPLFAAAGDLRWPMGWAFVLAFGAFAAGALLTLSPSLLAERSRVLAGSERGDAVVSVAFALLLYPGTTVACGLDRRFAASPPLPWPVEALALALFGGGYAFAFWAMRANPFFSAAVRIQADRGQRLVDGGPYRLVRHPGYAGTAAAHLAIPVALGSLWGLLPAVLGCALLAVRILGEERVLRRGLDGYAEYAGRVRWRLLPGVW